jgi:hypothetical protein
MQHNPEEWFHDSSGRPYARRLPSQPVQGRHELFGPGIGHKRTDKLFDGLITGLIIAVGVAMTAGLLTMTSPDKQPARPDTGSAVCDR